MNEPLTLNLIGGRQVDLRNPKTTDIHIDDIAGALSKLCRFSGHVREFYSVAQHCVLVARALPKDLQLMGLLHDASEAYLNDITRALKHSPEMAAYRYLEEKWENVIFLRYGLGEFDPRIKIIDRALARIEYATLLMNINLQPTSPAGRVSTMYTRGGHYDVRDASGLPYDIAPLTPGEAERLFLDTFTKLTTN